MLCKNKKTLNTLETLLFSNGFLPETFIMSLGKQIIEKQNQNQTKTKKLGVRTRVMYKFYFRKNKYGWNPEFLRCLQCKIMLHLIMYFVKLPPSSNIPQVEQQLFYLGSDCGVVLIKCTEQWHPQSLIGRTCASCYKYLCTNTPDLNMDIRY